MAQAPHEEGPPGSGEESSLEPASRSSIRASRDGDDEDNDDDRSLSRLPSAGTSVGRVDEEGRSLLHRGGASGGVYDSMVSRMSGIDGGGARVEMGARDDGGAATPAAAGNTGEEGRPELTEAALRAHGHEHQVEYHDRAVAAAAAGEERSLTHLPSASTSVDRVDDEGRSLLHRGGDSGGVFDSVGTMSQMSGIDPSKHNIFRAGVRGSGNGSAALESAGSADSFVRTASAVGEDDGAGSGDAAPLPPLARSRPKPVGRKSRKISWGVNSVDSDRSGDGASGAASGDGEGTGTETTADVFDGRRGILRAGGGGGFSGDENTLRHHRRGASLGVLVTNVATSVGRFVKSSRNLMGGSSNRPGASSKNERASKEGEEEGEKKKGAKLWGKVHRHLESIVLRGDHEGSDFDFSQVELDEEDLADLRAAGVPIEDGRVLETPAEIEERGGTAEEVVSAIRKRAKREGLLEEAETMKHKFDVKKRECVLAIGAYLAVSVVAYSFVFEKWPVIDSLYFAVVTFTTIGYGDLSPSTIPGQVFMCFFGFGGVAALGLALGVIGSDLVETRVDAVTSAREEAREHSHKEVLSLFESEDEGAKSEATETNEKSGLLLSSSQHEEGNRNFVSRCCKAVWSMRLPGMARMLLPLVAILFVGSTIIALLEGWSIFTGIYYGIVTTCTIGYGDRSPSLPSTRLFSVFFIPVAVAVMGQILGAFSSYVMEQRQKEFEQALHNVDLRYSHLEALSSKGNGIVTRLDYIEFSLQAMGIADRELLDELHERFDKLDKTGDGVVTEEDLKLMARKKLQGAKKKLELAEYKGSLLRKTDEGTVRANAARV